MLSRINQQQTNRTVGEVLRWATEDDGYFPIDLNPPYQRGAVWGVERKRNLIRSILLDLPIGAIFINHRDSANYSTPPRCVDGQQRLRTLAEFFNDEFAIPTDWVDDRDIDELPMVPEDHASDTIRFSELTKRGQRHIRHTTVAVYETYLPTEQDEAELFLLINYGGVAMTDEDKERAANVAGR